MQLPQIRLQQTYAQIGLRISQPIQEIQQKPADLSITQESAKLSIERRPSKLIIDDEQAWNELGFKNNGTFLADEVLYARQKFLENVAAIAEDGNQLAQIENNTNALANIAAENAYQPQLDYNLGFLPSPGSVKIQFTPTEIHLDWKRGGVDIQVTPHRAEHQYTPGKTEVYLKQKQQLQIDFVGTNINKQS
ncbi:DUF6470 family protein [Pseudoneobacillus sp. C159]